MLTLKERWAYNSCREKEKERGIQGELDYRRVVEDLSTGEHPGTALFCYSVGAGGSCSNSLPNVHPETKSQDV